MDAFVEFFQQFDYWGMFVASFIAGSIFPFSSEAVMTALLLNGAKPVPLFVSATVGNVAGSMFNYYIGRMGSESWRKRLMPKNPKKRERQERRLQKYGVWAGVLCFVPILGSALAVMMGYMRLNPWLSTFTIFLGKAVRYAVLIWIVDAAAG